MGGAGGRTRQRCRTRRNVLFFLLARLGEPFGWSVGVSLALGGRIVAREGLMGGAGRGGVAPLVVGCLPLVRRLLLAVAAGAIPRSAALRLRGLAARVLVGRVLGDASLRTRLPLRGAHLAPRGGAPRAVGAGLASLVPLRALGGGGYLPLGDRDARRVADLFRSKRGGARGRALGVRGGSAVHRGAPTGAGQ